MTSHVAFSPLQAPLQAESAKPGAGLAVSVTVPEPAGCEQNFVFPFVLEQTPPGPWTAPAPLTEIERPLPVPPNELEKEAVTLFAFVIPTVQIVLVPEQAPLQPANVAPKPGVAVSVTVAPAACAALQPTPDPEQLSPAPLTVPLPLTWELSTYVVFPPAKLAWTVFELDIVSVHVVDMKPEQSPPQPVKFADAPEAGTAVSVIVVFACTFAEQPDPPAAVQ